MRLLGRALPLAVEGRAVKASRDLSPCTQAPQVLLSVAEWGPPRVYSHLHPEGVAQLFAAARRKAPGEQRGTVGDELERGRGGEHGRGEGSARPDCVCRSRGSPAPRAPAAPLSTHPPRPAKAAGRCGHFQAGAVARQAAGGRPGPPRPEQQRYLARRARRSPEKQG